MDEAGLGRKLLLEGFLLQHRLHGTVDTEHLVVAGDNLACSAGAAVVEQDEVLDEIQQAVFGEHAVEKSLRVYPGLVLLVVALPLYEVLPFARDRAVSGLVAIADNEEYIVVEGVADAVLGHVVRQVVVETGTTRCALARGAGGTLRRSRNLSLVKRAIVSAGRRTLAVLAARVRRRLLCRDKVAARTGESHRLAAAQRRPKADEQGNQDAKERVAHR